MENQENTTINTIEKEAFEILKEARNAEKNKIVIEDSKNIEIYGDDEKIVSMLSDWSRYYGEVTNPENTAKNTQLGGSKYAPIQEVLNTVRPILSKHGLSMIQTPYMVDNKVKVKTIVTHKNGAIMSFPSAETSLTKLNNAVTEIQSFGLYSTYLRRFLLNAIAGVAGEIDNDGNNPQENRAPSIDKKKQEKQTDSILKNEMIELCKEKAKINKDEVVKIISKYGNKDGLVANIMIETEIKNIIKDLNKIKGEQ